MAATTNPLVRSTGQAQAGVRIDAGRPRLRFALPGALLTVELCAIAAMGHPWVPVGQSMAGPIVLLAALIFFGRRRLQMHRLTAHRVSWPMLGLHALAALLVLLCGSAMLRQAAAGAAAAPLLLAGWLLALAVMPGSLLVMLAPPREWLALSRRLGVVWAYAIGCAALAMSARRLELLAWDAPDSRLGQAMAAAAFAGVKRVLPLFFHDVAADPTTRVIGVGAFRIHVAGACSGIEGITLMLFLALGWMLFERRELRLLRAVWLTPIALALMWCLNVLRMVALIALGAAGQPEMAVKGFHTEAGWITFTLVAVGFLTAANRLPWLRRDTVQRRQTAGNPAIVFLLPIVALLAAGLVTQAFSNGFESLYPLRFAVSVTALLCLWKPLTAMCWRVGLTDVAVGLAVGAVWVWFSRGGDASVIREGLAALPSSARAVWLVARVLGAVVTVPLTEELAFRGFLARRLTTVRRLRVAEFEELPYRAIGWFGVVCSSVAFGAMHGHWWLLGTAAGMVFALLAKRRDSLGAAVLAHAAANAVLAVWALTTGDLSVW